MLCSLIDRDILKEPAASIFRDPKEGGGRWHHISKFGDLFIVSVLRTPNLTNFMSSLLNWPFFQSQQLKLLLMESCLVPDVLKTLCFLALWYKGGQVE